MKVKAVEFLTPLRVEAVGDKEWMLLSNFIGKVFMEDGTDHVIDVPAGFVCDLASVPRLPLMHMWFGGRARRSAVLHDKLYADRAPRKYADEVFRAAMRAEDESAMTRFAMWAGVRLGGGFVYDADGEMQWPDA